MQTFAHIVRKLLRSCIPIRAHPRNQRFAFVFSARFVLNRYSLLVLLLSTK